MSGLIQLTPFWCEGFLDAMDFVPLFADAHPEYELGWRMFWALKEIANG